ERRAVIKRHTMPEGGEGWARAPAATVVSLPADAKLTIDGAATASTSARRVFVSPALTPGKAYSYILKAEFTKDGKTVAVRKDVTVRAGQETSVSLGRAGLTGVASRQPFRPGSPKREPLRLPLLVFIPASVADGVVHPRPGHAAQRVQPGAGRPEAAGGGGVGHDDQLHALGRRRLVGHLVLDDRGDADRVLRQHAG